ncbi:hypothetical protein Tco_1398763 [Tanacetum coccineum]
MQELNITSQYVSGVEYFLNFAFEKSSKHGMILCPCMDCHNIFHLERAKVYDHLICVGFKRGYLNWTDHEESNEVSSSSMMENDEDEDNDHEMHEILHGLFLTMSMEGSMGEQEQERETEQEREREPERDFNRENNKSFSMLLEFLQEELLPHANILPKKHHEVKNIMNKLGLGWRPNQEDNAGDESGDEVGIQDEAGMQDEAGIQDEASLKKETVLQKKKAMNILRWFPLKPRLQRLFMSSKIAHLMKWHHLERVKDGKLRHPSDALSWKHFDEKHPEFARDH